MPTFRGKPTCSCVAEWLPQYEAALLRAGEIVRSVDIYQLTGNAAASAGVHRGGGAIDLVQRSTLAVKIARNMGAAAWARPTMKPPHQHMILKGCPHAVASAKAQVVELDNGGDGLVGNARDTGPRTGVKFPLRTWQQGIAWTKAQAAPEKVTTKIRPVTFNFPGGDKIGDVDARVKAGVALVKSARPTFVGFNELEGTVAGKPSVFASKVATALGAGFGMIVPTLPFNENYIAYDKAQLTLVHQYQDSVLKASTGGRHVTRVVFKHNVTGLVFAVGQTHLVNGNTAQHEHDRQATGGDAWRAMKAVSRKHGNCPFIIQGDMNTNALLTALTKAGMKRTRTFADTSTTRDAATYTRIDKPAPDDSLPVWTGIDQQYVSKAFYVVGYTVVRKLSGGKYAKPRPSDHDPVVSSVKVTRNK